eukprot:s711_g6.t1
MVSAAFALAAIAPIMDVVLDLKCQIAEATKQLEPKVPKFPRSHFNVIPPMAERGRQQLFFAGPILSSARALMRSETRNSLGQVSALSMDLHQ